MLAYFDLDHLEQMSWHLDKPPEQWMSNWKYLVGGFPVSRYSLADEIPDQNVPIATRNHHADRSKANSDFHDDELLLLLLYNLKKHLALWR